MNPRPALFITLDTIVRAPSVDSDGPWTFDAQLPGLLRDFHALGYALIGIFEPSLAVHGARHADCAALMTALHGSLRQAGAPELLAVVVADDVTDPKPIWDLKRRCGLNLSRSVLLGDAPRHDLLRANAGIGRIEPTSMWLGACQLAA